MLNLSDWPVSRRLFAVIAAALLMGVIFGGLRVVDAEASATQLSRVSQLANLGEKLTVLIDDLQNERDTTLLLISGTGDRNAKNPLYAATDSAVTAVQQAAAIGGLPSNIQAAVNTALGDIGPGRIQFLHSTLSQPEQELSVIANYGSTINDMITLADQVSQGVSDASLSSDVRAFNQLALAKEQASQQRALLNYSFTAGSTSTYNTPNTLVGVVDEQTEQALLVAYHQEFVDESGFQLTATPAELAAFADALSGQKAAKSVGIVEDIEQSVFAFNNNDHNYPGVVGSPLLDSVMGNVVLGNNSALIPIGGTATFVTTITPSGPNEIATPHGGITSIAEGKKAWAVGMDGKLTAMQSTETLLAGNISSRASQLQQSAQQSAIIFGIITVVVLLIVLLAALAVARSLVLPLRRLRAGALNIASVQLPERVKMLSESPESAASMQVAPINVVSEDEIGQVARAFDQVHSEAVRLAGEQALLRSSFNAMFVNLSRRSQSLIERLARMIDTLEQSEDDPDRLGSLFSMDHMVTRMRRNSENLLLLAGHENPRKWSDSIPLSDVARAATSEIEQYNRVTLNVPPGIAVIGQAVSDVVHLIAELVENATIFSPKDTQVQLTMQELTSGGVLIEIIDKGIGVSEARLADMNFRLDNPPTIDVSVSRHMGLFAVARLAERHRVRVRLRPATPQGLSALVWLPDSVIERTGRYSSVQSWSTQPTGSQAIVGARQGGSDMALDDGSSTLTQNGHGGNGYGGNGYGTGGNGAAGYGTGTGTGTGTGGSGYGTEVGTGAGASAYGTGTGAGAAAGAGSGGSSATGLPGREGRTASGWFRGQVAGAPPPSAPTGGVLGSAPDWSVRRVPGESLSGSSLAEQTSSAGLPVRTPRASQAPAAAPGAPASQVSQPAQGSQALPTRGSDPSRPTPSRGPVPRGPGGGSHALPQRSPDQARSRLSAFQRGTRRAEEQPGQTGQSGQFGQAPGAGEGSER